MAKPPKNRLRAQRKFAQGAYVPPHSNPPSAPTQVTVNANHRAVSAPGPVTKNVCSARDLLTRMSLGKAHHHTTDWPLVILEDCSNIINIESDKRKLKVKRKHNKRLLRNTRKNASDLPDVRRSSISDSEEDNDDTPLSHLQNPQVSPSKQVKNRPVRLTEGTAPKLPTEKESDKALDYFSSTSENIGLKRTTNGTTMPQKAKKKKCRPLGLDMIIKVVVERQNIAERKSSTPSSEPEEPPTRRLLKRQSNPSSPKSSNIKSNLPSSPESEDQPAQRRLSRNRKRCSGRTRHEPTYYSDNTASSIASSSNDSYKSTSKYKLLKKRALLKKRMRNNVKRTCRKITEKNTCLRSSQPSLKFVTKPRSGSTTKRHNNQPLPSNRCNPISSIPRFSTSSTTSLFHGFDKQPTKGAKEDNEARPSIDESSLDKDNKTSQANQNSVQTNDSEDDKTTLKWLMLTNETCLPENLQVASVQPEISTSSELVDVLPSCDSFKVPPVPVRFTKRAKPICPLRPIVNLHELLSSDLACHTCRRCTLVSMYKNVLKHVAVSRPDEPDILEKQPPPCPYGFDDGGIQSKVRGRDLVRNVLTKKSLPIWLSNLQMNLHKTMFEVEHKAGTLKKTLTLDPEDAADALVEKVITRLEYLTQCIIQDNIELYQLKQDRSSRTVKPGLRKNLPKSKPLRAPWITSLHETEITQPTLSNDKQKSKSDSVEPSVSRPADSIDTPAEASTTESRFLVVRLTPLSEVPGLDGIRAVDANSLNGGKKIKKSKVQTNQDGTQRVELDSAELPTGQRTEQVQPKQQARPLPPNENDEPELQTEAVRLASRPSDAVRVYHPTPEEFLDPITYIKSIEEEASKYGMCKIIPPAGFHVPCHLDDNCVFGTTNQHLGRLYHRWGPNSREMASIQTYLTSLTPRDKEHFTKAPMFDGVEVDLVKLYHLVLKQGGIEGYLAHNEKWARIASQMNFVSPRGRPDSKKLEKLYCKHVLPYESLTPAERQTARDKAEKIWKIRVKNQILRASRPLHYQNAMLSESAHLPEYEEAFPDADLADLYNICKPIYDKIEECTGKGRAMNLATFRRISSQIQGMRFPNGLPATITEIERKYWEILNLGNEHVCVLSAFIDTSVDNLGHESDPRASGGNHPWNLKRIGENPKNILRSLGKALSVTVPTLCLNQLYSTNCWHMDPHKLAWLDYMHEGATKIWYSVPDTGAPAFRRAVQMMTEAAVQDKGIWLASDTTMIPPGNLKACGVPVQRIEQNPNEFIVVFPGAYACSISTGLSVAESVYFETDNWLQRVENVFEDMHKDCEPSMFSCVLLMMKMAQNLTLSFDTLVRVYTILKRLFTDEFDARRDAQSLRCKLTVDKCGRLRLMPVSWPNQEECCLCRIPLVLSKMSKYDEPRKQMCLSHGMKYMRLVKDRPDTDRPEQPPVVTVHYTDQELTEMITDLEQRVMDIAVPLDEQEDQDSEKWICN